MSVRRVSLSDTRRFVRAAEARQAPLRRLLDVATRRTGVTSVGLMLAGLAAAAWVVAYAAGGRPVFLLCYGAIIVLVGSWAYGRRPLPLEGRRSAIRARVQEGQQVTVEVALSASRPISNLVLEEQLPTLLGDHVRLPVATVEPGGEVTHEYELTCWRRGVFQLGPLVARWGDPFGLTERELTLAEPFDVIVHPRIEVAEDHPLTRLWEDPPFRPPVSKPWPHGMEFYGMRRYAPGDDLRKIVWRAYARTGNLLVRESEQGITDKLVVVFDQDRRHHSPGIVSDSFEAACRVIASLGVHHLKEGYSVSLEGTADRLAGPLRGPTARIQLLDSLARAEPAEGGLPALLQRLLTTMSRDAHLVLVTPLLDAAAAARLRLFVDRGMSVVVVALMWLDEAVDTLASAASLGVRVVEVGPNTNISTSFRREVAARGVR